MHPYEFRLMKYLPIQSIISVLHADILVRPGMMRGLYVRGLIERMSVAIRTYMIE